jgi:hypothetical protein
VTDFKALDKELSWSDSGAATSPIFYPNLPGECEQLTERSNWIREQARIEACQVVSEFELRMLVKFEMLRWLGCEML